MFEVLYASMGIEELYDFQVTLARHQSTPHSSSGNPHHQWKLPVLVRKILSDNRKKGFVMYLAAVMLVQVLLTWSFVVFWLARGGRMKAWVLCRRQNVLPFVQS